MEASVFSRLAIPALRVNIKSNKIIDANIKALEILGDKNSIIGQNISQLFVLKSNKLTIDYDTINEYKNVKCRLCKNKANSFSLSVQVLNKSDNFAYVFLSKETNIAHPKIESNLVFTQLKKLVKAVEQSPVIIVITAKDGKIEYVNPKFTQSTGYTLKEVRGQTPRILKSGKQTLKKYQDLWSTILDGKEWKGELQNKKKNGELYWESVHISSIQNEKREITHFLKVSEDVTEQKQNKKALFESEKKFRTLFKNNPNLMLLADFEKKIILEVNKAYCDKIGYTEEEVINMPGKLGFSFKSSNDFNNIFVKAKQQFEVRGEEILVKTSQGKELTFLVYAEPIKIGQKSLHFITGIDISDLKKTEQAYFESEYRFMTVFHKNPIPTSIIRASDNSYIDVNNAWERFTAYSKNQALGKTPTELRILEQENFDLVLTKLKALNSFKNYELDIRTKKGITKSCLYSMEFMKFENELYLINNLIDITDRKLFNARLFESELRYKSLFNESPVPLWEEDFTELVNYIEKIKQKWKGNFDEYFEKYPDELIKCAQKVKIIDVNKATLKLHEAKNKKQLLVNLDKIFTKNSYLAFKKEVIQIASGKSKFNATGEIKTLSGKKKQIQLNLIIDKKNKNRAILSTIDISLQIQNEAKLLKLSSQNREILQTMIDGYILADDKGKIIDVNKAYCKMVKYSKRELLNFNIRQMEVKIPPDEIQRRINHMIKKGYDRFQTLHKRKDGKSISLDVSINIIKDSNRKLVAAFVKDISHQQEILQSLKDSEYKFRKIIEQSADGIVISDENGRVISWNKSLTHITGLKAKDMLGKLIWDAQFEMTSPNKQTNVYYNTLKKSIKDFMLTGKAKWSKSLMEREYIDKNGKVKYIQGTTFPIKTENGFMLCGISRDITEKVQNLKDIQQKEQNYRSLFEEASDGILVLDGDNNIIDVNKKFCQMLGYSYSKLKAMKALQFIHPDDLKQKDHKKAFTKLLKGKTIENQYRLLKQNGQYIFTELSTKYIGNNRFLNIIRDVTERKKNEDELANYRNHLEKLVKERTNELEELNTELESFAYSVTHDLRAPVRAISGFSSILSSKYNDLLDEKGKHYLETIVKNTVKMDQLILDLLKISKISMLKMLYHNVDMKMLAQSTYNEIATVNEKKDFEFVLHDIPNAYADQITMKQVWVNLISNALKFSANSKVKKIEIGFDKKYEKPYYFIKDWGAGFDARFKDKLFSVFQRLHTESEFSGTGVGLSIVAKIIKRHNGTIWANGKPGKGACFYFTIPEINS